MPSWVACPLAIAPTTLPGIRKTATRPPQRRSTADALRPAKGAPCAATARGPSPANGRPILNGSGQFSREEEVDSALASRRPPRWGPHPPPPVRRPNVQSDLTSSVRLIGLELTVARTEQADCTSGRDQEFRGSRMYPLMEMSPFVGDALAGSQVSQLGA
ncbi:hypothetical protein EJB05_47874, partial [Eragrostis curvula]